MLEFRAISLFTGLSCASSVRMLHLVIERLHHGTCTMFGGLFSFLGGESLIERVERTNREKRIRNLELELQLCRARLKHVDNPQFYSHEVDQCRAALETVRQRYPFKHPVVRMGEQDLEKARVRLEHFQQNPRAFVATRQRQLEMEIMGFEVELYAVQQLSDMSSPLESKKKQQKTQDIKEGEEQEQEEDEEEEEEEEEEGRTTTSLLQARRRRSSPQTN